jgi:indolepyruvate decarboxylase
MKSVKLSKLTVIQHVLNRLKEIGISEIFGVAGDFAFSIDDAIASFPGIEYVGCCNELNAAYAAEGYARIRGIGAVTTTYGVGELSAINGIAGAYAEHLPVFHLTGMPSMAVQVGRKVIHHTLGDGEFEYFRRMAEPVVCASVIMTPQNVAYETERLIAEALYHRRPVYMAFPMDVANQTVVSSAQPLDPPVSDPGALQSATNAINAALKGANSACILPGLLAVRVGAREELQSFVDASGLPFATMFADKSVLEEQQPAYIGMYDGKLMDEQVRNFVESCDLVFTIGTMMSDFNTGGYTSNLDPDKIVNISHHHTQIGSKVYPNVEMKDILSELARNVKRSEKSPLEVVSLGAPVGSGTDPITADALYPRWANFLKPDDIIITETGTASMGLAFATMPKGASFHNQTLWGSIGWATPAAFGAAVAAPHRRLILITGEGSHQLTAQEISQIGRRGLKNVIVFVLNNSGYLIERLLCKHPDFVYNDLAEWHYSELPHALGCDDWFTARVMTCGEFDQALTTAGKGDSSAYIEVVTDKYAAPPVAAKLHESTETLYQA